ncbi:hypothetical protein AN958_00401 [Leucoagaricus sp. SymC.cos]|nr:hypothetical protein AN958_00401 [Leucoagaricus sp. SymC.cos]
MVQDGEEPKLDEQVVDKASVEQNRKRSRSSASEFKTPSAKRVRAVKDGNGSQQLSVNGTGTARAPRGQAKPRVSALKSRQGALRNAGQAIWTVVASEASVTQAVKPTTVDIRPRLWTSSRKELESTFVEIAGSKCVNNISWMAMEMPIMILDDDSILLEKVKDDPDGLSMDVIFTREFMYKAPPASPSTETGPLVAEVKPKLEAGQDVVMQWPIPAGALPTLSVPGSQDSGKDPLSVRPTTSVELPRQEFPVGIRAPPLPIAVTQDSMKDLPAPTPATSIELPRQELPMESEAQPLIAAPVEQPPNERPVPVRQPEATQKPDTSMDTSPDMVLTEPAQNTRQQVKAQPKERVRTQKARLPKKIEVISLAQGVQRQKDQRQDEAQTQNVQRQRKGEQQSKESPFTQVTQRQKAQRQEEPQTQEAQPLKKTRLKKEKDYSPESVRQQRKKKQSKNGALAQNVKQEENQQQEEVQIQKAQTQSVRRREKIRLKEDELPEDAQQSKNRMKKNPPVPNARESDQQQKEALAPNAQRENDQQTKPGKTQKPLRQRKTEPKKNDRAQEDALPPRKRAHKQEDVFPKKIIEPRISTQSRRVVEPKNNAKKVAFRQKNPVLAKLSFKKIKRADSAVPSPSSETGIEPAPRQLDPSIRGPLSSILHPLPPLLNRTIESVIPLTPISPQALMQTVSLSNYLPLSSQWHQSLPALPKMDTQYPKTREDNKLPASNGQQYQRHLTPLTPPSDIKKLSTNQATTEPTYSYYPDNRSLPKYASLNHTLAQKHDVPLPASFLHHPTEEFKITPSMNETREKIEEGEIRINGVEGRNDVPPEEVYRCTRVRFDPEMKCNDMTIMNGNRPQSVLSSLRRPQVEQQHHPSVMNSNITPSNLAKEVLTATGPLSSDQNDTRDGSSGSVSVAIGNTARRNFGKGKGEKTVLKLPVTPKDDNLISKTRTPIHPLSNSLNSIITSRASSATQAQAVKKPKLDQAPLDKEHKLNAVSIACSSKIKVEDMSPAPFSATPSVLPEPLREQPISSISQTTVPKKRRGCPPKAAAPPVETPSQPSQMEADVGPFSHSPEAVTSTLGLQPKSRTKLQAKQAATTITPLQRAENGVPLPIPAELQALVDAYITCAPVGIFTASKQLKRFWGLDLVHHEEIAYTFMGFYRVSRILESLVGSNNGVGGQGEGRETLVQSEGITRLKARWKFRMKWEPGGEDWQAVKRKKLSSPWWNPTIQHPRTPQPDQPDSDNESTNVYRLARQQDPNFIRRYCSFGQSFFSVLPLHLLAPIDADIPDWGLPRGWHLVLQFLLSAEREGYVVGIDRLRDPQEALPLSLPLNELPICGHVTSKVQANSGAACFYLQFEKPTGGFVRVAETNSERRSIAEVNRGYPYFRHSVDDGHDASVTHSTWASASSCLRQARNLMLNRARKYSRKSGTEIEISRLDIRAWVTAGNKRSSDLLCAKQRCMVIMCLGCEVIMSFRPKSAMASNDDQAHIPRFNTLIPMDSFDLQEDQSQIRPGEGIKVETELALGESEYQINPPAGTALTRSKAASKVQKWEKTVLSVSLIHGDVVILEGDDFEVCLLDARVTRSTI